MAEAERWAVEIGGPAYAMDDQTAIKVVDGNSGRVDNPGVALRGGFDLGLGEIVGGNEGAGTSAALHEPALFEFTIGARDRVHCETEVAGQLPHRGQSGADDQFAVSDTVSELAAHLLIRRDGGLLVDGDHANGPHGPATSRTWDTRSWSPRG